MELALSLGDTPKSFFPPTNYDNSVGFCIALSDHKRVSSDPPLQLHLLPSTPVLPIPWLPDPQIPPRTVDDIHDGAALSSPVSAVSCFQMEQTESLARVPATTTTKMAQRGRNSDSLKNNQLSSKTASNNTPLSTPTKLKQTEVDCEYLKRYWESLKEENRRLQKELQKLRVLKTCQPFYRQLLATTLTMCPSCERVATNTTGGAAVTTTTNNNRASKISAALSVDKPRILP